jgi:exopolysaccharide biosynthesis protein
VSLLNTGQFAINQKTLLAITANTGPGNVTGCGTPAGLLVSNGKLANPGQTNGPVLYFNSRTQAAITGGTVPTGVQWAVSGSTNTNNDCPDLYQPGTLLVQSGKPGVCPIPKSTAPAGRGAVGLDSTGKYVIVVVVEGTDNGGVLTSDLAQMLIALKAVNAVNFDGGGSTAFYWLPASQTSVPPVSAAAQKMITDAKFPPSLNLTVTPFLPKDEERYDSEDRAVYASLGFTFTP